LSTWPTLSSARGELCDDGTSDPRPSLHCPLSVSKTHEMKSRTQNHSLNRTSDLNVKLCISFTTCYFSIFMT
jgi:hypothetical protein